MITLILSGVLVALTLVAVCLRVASVRNAYLDRLFITQAGINGSIRILVNETIRREWVFLFKIIVVCIMDLATIFVLQHPQAHPLHPWYTRLEASGFVVINVLMAWDAVHWPTVRRRALRRTVAPLPGQHSRFGARFGWLWRWLLN